MSESTTAGRRRAADPIGGSSPPSQRIRVLRLIARLNTGGPAIHATLLTERLDPARYASVLVAGRLGRGEGDYLELHGRSVERLIDVPTLGRELRPAADLSTLGRLVALMRAERPHIVHTHTAKAGVLGRLAARITRVPVVVHTYHGHVLDGYFSPGRRRLFLAIERGLAHVTDRLIAVSATVRRELLALGIGSDARFRVVPLGLDLARFLGADVRRGELRAELGVGPDEFLVGIVARLVPIKRHEDLLRAFALVADRLPPARLVIVGDGECRRELERGVDQRALRDRVTFLGWRRDLDRIYADLDLVVLASANEGSPVALIEAMAAGRAVLGTRVGGVPDVVSDGVTGVLVPPRDPAALGGAMLSLLADPARLDKLGQAGRERVVPAYSAERLLADTDRVYRELLAEKLGGPA